jgi:hypothetical protein
MRQRANGLPGKSPKRPRPHVLKRVDRAGDARRLKLGLQTPNRRSGTV